MIELESEQYNITNFKKGEIDCDLRKVNRFQNLEKENETDSPLESSERSTHVFTS